MAQGEIALEYQLSKEIHLETGTVTLKIVCESQAILARASGCLELRILMHLKMIAIH